MRRYISFVLISAFHAFSSLISANYLHKHALSEFFGRGLTCDSSWATYAYKPYI